MSVLRELERRTPTELVLQTDDCRIDNGSLRRKIEETAMSLQSQGALCVALYADNGPEWIVADLACLAAGIRVVPIPLFFTPAQIRHVIKSSAADTLLTDRPVDSLGIDSAPVNEWPASAGLKQYAPSPRESARLPGATWKITYTSGTTGAPKGVCLSAAHLETVAASLATVTGLRCPRHLCVLPLSTLLENVAGVYAPLLAGGTVIVPQLADVGLTGSAALDTARFLASIDTYQPNSLILVPEFLRVLTVAAERSWRPPASLRFVAVGGGKVAPDLLQRAQQAGLPVYEGYGLSECASVVSLNTPDAMCVGSVGRPLPHVRVSEVGGELKVSGSAMLGYVGQPETWGVADVATGDLGRIDESGYIHADGRAGNLIITSFGRNVSPEWPESELLASPLISQAVVIGNARPWCTALLLPTHRHVSDQEIDAAVRRANSSLPDYARIANWYRLPAPLTAADELLTTNGRPRRAAIESRYQVQIETLYEPQPEAINQ